MGQRGRHQGTVIRGQAMGLGELDDLVGKRSMGMDHPPRRAGRPRSEHDHRIGVGSALAPWPARRGIRPRRQFIQREEVGATYRREVRAGDGDHRPGLGQRYAHLVRARRGVQRHRYRSDPPAGAVRDHRIHTDGQAECHPVARHHAAGR